MSKFTLRALRLAIIYSTIGLCISTFFGQTTFAIAAPVSPPAVPVQTSPTQTTAKYPGLAPSDYNSEGLPRCYDGEQPVPCSQAWKSIKNIATWMLLGGVAFILCMLGSIFSIFMIIHAANNPIKDKTGWILLILFTSFIGGIMYYFAVKRKFDRNSPPPPLQPPLNPQPPVQPPAV